MGRTHFAQVDFGFALWRRVCYIIANALDLISRTLHSDARGVKSEAPLDESTTGQK